MNLGDVLEVYGGRLLLETPDDLDATVGNPANLTPGFTEERGRAIARAFPIPTLLTSPETSSVLEALTNTVEVGTQLSSSIEQVLAVGPAAQTLRAVTDLIINAFVAESAQSETFKQFEADLLAQHEAALKERLGASIQTLQFALGTQGDKARNVIERIGIETVGGLSSYTKIAFYKKARGIYPRFSQEALAEVARVLENKGFSFAPETETTVQ